LTVIKPCLILLVLMRLSFATDCAVASVNQHQDTWQ